MLGTGSTSACPLADKGRLASIAHGLERRYRPCVVDAGQHGGAYTSGAKKDGGDKALDRSRRKFSGKLTSDTFGNPLCFDLRAGQAGDIPRALGPIDGIET